MFEETIAKIYLYSPDELGDAIDFVMSFSNDRGFLLDHDNFPITL